MPETPRLSVNLELETRKAIPWRDLVLTSIDGFGNVLSGCTPESQFEPLENLQAEYAQYITIAVSAIRRYRDST
jgi:hypothetical protein